MLYCDTAVSPILWLLLTDPAGEGTLNDCKAEEERQADDTNGSEALFRAAAPVGVGVAGHGKLKSSGVAVGGRKSRVVGDTAANLAAGPAICKAPENLVLADESDSATTTMLPTSRPLVQ